MGAIPTDWGEEPIKHAVTLVNGAVFKPDSWSESGVPIVRIENLNGGESYNYCDHFVSPRYHLHKGDLVFAWSGNRGTSFGPFIWDRDGLYYLNQHIFKVVEHNFDDRWLYWTMKALTHHVEEKAHGIIGMVHITKGELGEIRIPKIDRHEQTAIANFLDRETAKIDTLIDKQRQLIKLLEEKRQAVISHAVTKGLNPDVRMKDSGVEWLGEVPEHWDMKRLKHIIATLESGTSVNAEDTPASDGHIGVLKTSCVYTREFRGDENKTVFEYEITRVKCPVRAGQIIISRMNTPDLVGAAAYVDREYEGIYLPDRLWQTCFTDERNQDANYIALYMGISGFRDQISIYAEGASGSMRSIAKEDFLNLPVLLPPSEEQAHIAREVEVRLRTLDNARHNGRRQIELLHERRTALISAAVTGKIDVRNAV